MLIQARRALEYLHPDNLSIRTSANWTLGVAHRLQGNRAAARQALTEAIFLGQVAGNLFTTILATLGLGDIQVAENQLSVAAETYRRVLQLLGDPPLPVASEAHLGLARIFYEWNDLDAAERRRLHARVSPQAGFAIPKQKSTATLVKSVKDYDIGVGLGVGDSVRIHRADEVSPSP